MSNEPTTKQIDYLTSLLHRALEPAAAELVVSRLSGLTRRQVSEMIDGMKRAPRYVAPAAPAAFIGPLEWDGNDAEADLANAEMAFGYC